MSRAAPLTLILAFGAGLSATALPAAAQEAQAVRDVLGRAQQGAERNAVESLLNRLRGAVQAQPAQAQSAQTMPQPAQMPAAEQPIAAASLPSPVPVPPAQTAIRPAVAAAVTSVPQAVVTTPAVLTPRTTIPALATVAVPAGVPVAAVAAAGNVPSPAPNRSVRIPPPPQTVPEASAAQASVPVRSAGPGAGLRADGPAFTPVRVETPSAIGTPFDMRRVTRNAAGELCIDGVPISRRSAGSR